MTTPRPDAAQRIILGGVPVDLAERSTVAALVARGIESTDRRPLLIASANLHHLGAFRPTGPLGAFFEQSTNTWLVLVDGAPLAKRAARLTGRTWPLLAGSDLLPDLLADVSHAGARVGFLGGAPELGPPLRAACLARWPGLVFAGHWAPTRAELDDHARLVELAAAINAADVSMLVVGLGKPRQERWLDAWAVDAGIRVGLAFGASAEFLVGEQQRAPEWVRTLSAEWIWRLASDPKRLARRYLIEGPGEYLRLRRDSHL